MKPVLLTLEEIEPEFLERVRTVIWCNGSTVDARGRPRSRVLHPVWEGAVGWVTTRRSSPKIAHIAANPAVSLAYVHDPFRPVYVECRAEVVDDLETKRRVWELCRATPEPVGFDPAAVWGAVEDPENVLLRLQPWRIELDDFAGAPVTKLWRAPARAASQ